MSSSKRTLARKRRAGAVPTRYALTLRDESDGAEEESEIESMPARIDRDARCAAHAWARGGDWGDSGEALSVETYYRAVDTVSGEVAAAGDVTTEIEANEDLLIRHLLIEAGFSRSGREAIEECEHSWTSEGEGGCDENPGVWSTGGTSMLCREHCEHCLLVKETRTTGSQRNPGEPAESVSFSLREDEEEETQ